MQQNFSNANEPAECVACVSCLHQLYITLYNDNKRLTVRYRLTSQTVKVTH